MAKPAMSSLKYLKMLKKKNPRDVEFYTSSQVPEGKCYVFTHAKGSSDDNAMKAMKHDGGVHAGYCAAVTLWLAIIGSVTLVNYSCKGFQWIIKEVSTEKDG